MIMLLLIFRYQSLREECPNTDLVRIFLCLYWIQKNTDQKKLSIWTLFTQWVSQCWPQKLNNNKFDLLFNAKLKLKVILDILNVTSFLCQNLSKLVLKFVNHIGDIYINCSRHFRELQHTRTYKRINSLTIAPLSRCFVMFHQTMK